MANILSIIATKAATHTSLLSIKISKGLSFIGNLANSRNSKSSLPFPNTVAIDKVVKSVTSCKVRNNVYDIRSIFVQKKAFK